MSDPTPGVLFVPPPVEIQPSILAAIDRAVAALPPGASGSLVGLVNEQGANAVVVSLLPHGWRVEAWIAKRWDADLTYGAVVRKTWS